MSPASSQWRRFRQGRRRPGDGLPGLLPAPRTAVAYMLVCALEVAAASGIAPSPAAEVEAAAAFLESGRDELRHDAAEVAAAIGDRIPIIYGAGPTAAAARRWKTQVNENAKLPAFCSELPEANTTRSAPGGARAAPSWPRSCSKTAISTLASSAGSS